MSHSEVTTRLHDTAVAVKPQLLSHSIIAALPSPATDLILHDAKHSSAHSLRAPWSQLIGTNAQAFLGMLAIQTEKGGFASDAGADISSPLTSPEAP